MSLLAFEIGMIFYAIVSAIAIWRMSKNIVGLVLRIEMLELWLRDRDVSEGGNEGGGLL